MQIKYLHKSIYRLYKHCCKHELISEEIERRKKYLNDWEILKKRKVPDKEIAEITGMSRATFYRRKRAIKEYGLRGLESKSKRPHKVRQSAISEETKRLILRIRKQDPTYGKAKIAVILKRDHKVMLSESSVGRILKDLMQRKLVTKSRSASQHRRKRVFNKHAKAWQYGIKPRIPGQLVQIDHMLVTKNGIHFKHFQAWDPFTKSVVAEVYSNANSLAAAKFLHKVIKQVPFRIQSVQVDGGSEFMAHFEQACKDNNIELFVLPPKRPQYNGGVERTNRTFREEFYDSPSFTMDSIASIRLALDNAVYKHNHYRPHYSLRGLTPSEYTNLFLQNHPASQSHML
jgi:putative transposase